jgi:hypothetical protein
MEMKMVKDGVVAVLTVFGVIAAITLVSALARADDQNPDNGGGGVVPPKKPDDAGPVPKVPGATAYNEDLWKSFRQVNAGLDALGYPVKFDKPKGTSSAAGQLSSFDYADEQPSKASTRAFQGDANRNLGTALKEDGIPGPKTLNALEDAVKIRTSGGKWERK